MGQYRLYAVIWFFIFGFLGDYFEPGFFKYRFESLFSAING